MPSVDRFDFFKGLAYFVPLKDEIKNKLLENIPSFVFDETLDWYLTENHTIGQFYTTYDIFINPVNLQHFKDSFILMSYDKNTGVSNLYTGVYQYFNSTGNWELRFCYDFERSSYEGTLRPAVAQTSRFYYDNDTSDTGCPTGGLDDSKKRQMFLDLTMLPTSSGLLTVPAAFQ